MIVPSFQRVNRPFIFLFENNTGRFNLPKIEAKDYNVMIHSWNAFDPSVKNDIRTVKTEK